MQEIRLFPQRVLFYIALVSTTAFAWSCSSTPTEQHVQLTGSLVGTVILVDSDTLVSDRSGIRVWLDGTDLITFTDPKGNWRLDDVAARSYVVRFEKEGFGESQATVLHFGGVPTPVRRQTLCRIPICAPRLDSLIYSGEVAYVMGELPCVTNQQYSLVAYFFSNSPDVSKEDGKFDATRMTVSSQYTYCAVSRNDFLLGGQWYDSSLDPDKTIYVVGYALGCGDIFTDSLSGKMIYPSISPMPSNVLSFNL